MKVEGPVKGGKGGRRRLKVGLWPSGGRVGAAVAIGAGVPALGFCLRLDILGQLGFRV